MGISYRVTAGDRIIYRVTAGHSIMYNRVTAEQPLKLKILII